MKFRLTTSIWLRYTVAAVACLAVFSACEKNEDAAGGATASQTRLNIKVKGIEAFTDAQQPEKTAASFAIHETGGAAPEYTTYSFENAELITSSTEGWADNEGWAGTAARNPQRYAATEPVATSVKYRFMLYDKENGQLTPFFNEQFSSGTAATMDLVTGKTYQWVAYSYNNTDNIPSPGDLNNPTLQTDYHKELLWATGEFDVPDLTPTPTNPEPSQTINIDLTFNRMVAAIAVTVDATQTYGSSISALSARFKESDYIKTGTFNLIEGVTKNLQSANVQNITFENVSNEIKQAVYYTYDATGLESFDITVNELTIENPTGQKQVVAQPQDITFGPYTAALGNKLNATMNIIDNVVTVGGIRWSRGMLAKGAPGTPRTFTHPDYHNQNDLSIYDGSAGSGQIVFNPCNFAVPQGAWRMPTQDEYEVLVDLMDRGWYTLNNSNPREGYYVQFQADDDENDYLRFYALGRRDHINGELDYFDEDGDDRRGYYWSGTPDGNNESYAFRFEIEDDDDEADLVRTIGINRDEGANIRCVRND